MTKKLRIGLIGFGQTGRLAANEILKDPACELVWVARRRWPDDVESVSRLLGHDDKRGLPLPVDAIPDPGFFKRHRIDCLLDFSTNDGVHLYPHAAKAGVRIISVVSHYDEPSQQALKALSRDTAVLWSPNITLGINFIMAAAKIFRRMVPTADVQIIEEHFGAKKGVSGTALRIAEALAVDPADTVRSVRAGGIVGKHEIIFGMPNQIIRLRHESVSKAVFGRSAMLAAKWLSDKPKGLYTMNDMMVRMIRDACGPAPKPRRPAKPKPHAAAKPARRAK